METNIKEKTRRKKQIILKKKWNTKLLIFIIGIFIISCNPVFKLVKGFNC